MYINISFHMRKKIILLSPLFVHFWTFLFLFYYSYCFLMCSFFHKTDRFRAWIDPNESSKTIERFRKEEQQFMAKVIIITLEARRISSVCNVLCTDSSKMLFHLMWWNNPLIDEPLTATTLQPERARSNLVVRFNRNLMGEIGWANITSRITYANMRILDMHILSSIRRCIVWACNVHKIYAVHLYMLFSINKINTPHTV